jgi:nucleoside-diphosphate-sugar epimerase
MRVLVAGATGAIGRPLISALVASRREVIGITSTQRGVQNLRDRGAEAFVADALDRNAIEAIIRKVRPEIVIDELTSLPKKYTPEEMKAAAERDRKVRLVEQYPVIGSGQGVFSFVHVEDAAIATVAALEADPGVYNVVDDDPSDMNIWLPAFARFLGAPVRREITEAEALRTAGADSIYYATQLRGASNGRAKQKLGFAPRKLEWLSKTRATRAAHP